MPGRKLADPKILASRDDAELVALIRNGQRNMPGFRILLQEDEVRGLVGHLRKLAKGRASGPSK